MPMTRNHTSTVPADLYGAKRGVRQFLFPASLSFSAIAASLLIMNFAPAPVFWLLLTWAAALWAAMFGVSGSWPRAILFNLGIVACMLAGVEAYLVNHEYLPRVYTPGFMDPDDLLGWAPAKGMQAKAVEIDSIDLFHYPVRKISDTVYTVDSNGLRVAPPYSNSDLAGTALFFGCSYTFGAGLKDDETLPYQVGIQSEGRYRTFNFAFVGYGPNQMLAAIEAGMVGRVVDTTPRYVYYVAIPHHVWRAAGRVGWIHHMPRYVPDAEGTLQRAGYFEGRKPLGQQLGFGWPIEGLLNGIERQLNKAAIWRRAPGFRFSYYRRRHTSLFSDDSPLTRTDHNTIPGYSVSHHPMAGSARQRRAAIHLREDPGWVFPDGNPGRLGGRTFCPAIIPAGKSSN